MKHLTGTISELVRGILRNFQQTFTCVRSELNSQSLTSTFKFFDFDFAHGKLTNFIWFGGTL